MELQEKDIAILQGVCDFFEEFDSFFETAKTELGPILDVIWGHYDNNQNRDQAADNLMLGMSMKHDHGRKWTLLDAIDALKYAKIYMDIEGH